MLKRLFALSDKGAADLKKGGAASAFSSLSLFVPMALCLMLLQEICKPLLGEKADSPNIWLYTVLAVVSVVVIFIANFIEYRCTYIAAYEESATRRITLAEKLRKLPLSYFGEHDLAEMTTSMMSDCNELERTFSGAISPLLLRLQSVCLYRSYRPAARQAAAARWISPHCCSGRKIDLPKYDTGLQGHRIPVNSAVVPCSRYSQGSAGKYITRRLPFCGSRRIHFSRLL